MMTELEENHAAVFFVVSRKLAHGAGFGNLSRCFISLDEGKKRACPNPDCLAKIRIGASESVLERRVYLAMLAYRAVM
jgi:hypothetical protein